MYFKNIYFHGVSSMQQCENGSYQLLKFPTEIISQFTSTDGIFPFNDASGIELRFKLLSDSATLTLSLESDTPSFVEMYFGSNYAGDKYKILLAKGNNQITIFKEDIPPKSTDKAYHPFSNEVVRVVLPYGAINYVGIEGEICYPNPFEMPLKRIAFLGGLNFNAPLKTPPTQSIPFFISKQAKTDYEVFALPEDSTLFKSTVSHIDKQNYQLLVTELITSPIEGKKYKKVLREIKRKLHFIKKTKCPVIFIDKTVSYGNFKKAKHHVKFNKKLAKLLKKHAVMLYGEDFIPSDNSVLKISYVDTVIIANAIYNNALKALSFTPTKKQIKKSERVYISNTTGITSPQLTPDTLDKSEVKELIKEKQQLEKERRKSAKKNSKSKPKNHKAEKIESDSENQTAPPTCDSMTEDATNPAQNTDTESQVKPNPSEENATPTSETTAPVSVGAPKQNDNSAESQPVSCAEKESDSEKTQSVETAEKPKNTTKKTKNAKPKKANDETEVKSEKAEE